MAATRAALAVLVVCCLAGGTLHSTGAAPCVPAPALGRVLRLRGAGASNLAGLVYADGDAAACMGATVRTVRPRSSPRDAAEDTIVAAFDALVKLANATGDAAAQTGAAHGAEQREDRWWEQPNTTRDDILAYLRARDPAVPDTDDRPRLNAELAAAAAGGSMRKIRELVAQGAQVNAGGTASGMWAPLHHAARHRHPRAVRALLNLDARVNITTWGRWTPLHLAAAVGAGEIARMLLEAGANMYAVNSDGKTPFDVINADVDGGENVTDVLLRFGFNPRANAAAKAQVRFFAPQLPRRRDGVLPCADLMLGAPDDYLVLQIVVGAPASKPAESPSAPAGSQDTQAERRKGRKRGGASGG